MKISIVLAALTGQFETDMNRASKTVQRRAKEIEKTFKQVGVVIGTAFVAASTAIAVGVKSAIDRMDDIIKASQKVGISSESFSKLAYAASLAGVEMTNLETALAKLARSQDDAARGTKETLDLFNALGVEFRNADGTLRRTDEVFSDLADRFKELPDGANKTAAAMGLLGRSGAQLIPLLNGGSEGLAEMGDELERMGGVVTPEAARQAEEFNDNITRLQVAMDGLFMSIAKDLLPELVRLTEAFVDGAKEGNNYSNVAHQVSAAIATVAETAFAAYKYIESLTNAIVGFTARSVEFATKFIPQFALADQFFTGGAIGRESGILAQSSEARAGETFQQAREGLGLGRGEFIDPTQGVEQNEEAARRLADALEVERGAQERAAAARRAAAEAAREAARAQREAEKEAKRIAEEAFEQRMDMIKMAAEEKRQREEALKEGAQLRDDLLFDLELIKMTNAERATAIQLRGLDAEAVKKYGEEIARLNKAIEAELESIAAMDRFRASFEDAFASILDGTKSVKDAFRDMADAIIAQIARMIAQQWVAKLFGDPNTPGGGLFGDIVSSFFGGFRASGGPVSYGKAYIVGEQGPELFIPPGNGTIMNATQTARMGQRGAQVINNFNMPGRYDLRTQAQIAATTGRTTQRALSRGTA